MGILIGLAVLLLGGGYFTRQVSQVPRGSWAGPRTAGMKQRPAGQRSVRQESRLEWNKAKATNWLEHQRHIRKTGGSGQSAAAVANAPAPSRRGLASVRRRPAAPAGGAGAPTAPPATVTPLVPRTRPAPSNGSPGRNTTVPTTTGNSVEQFVEGVNQIHASAQAGGIRAKHAAVKASHEGCVRFAAMEAMMARQMSEPGQNYGPEITEPIAKAATHLQAAAMALSEADANIATLGNTTVFDLAQSARQAPHHDELSEDGSR